MRAEQQVMSSDTDFGNVNTMKTRGACVSYWWLRVMVEGGT